MNGGGIIRDNNDVDRDACFFQYGFNVRNQS